MINFLTLNLALFLSSVLFSFKFVPDSRKSNLGLLFYSLFFFLSSQIVIQTILGAVNLLNITAVSVSVYLIFTVLLILTARYFQQNFKLHQFQINWLAILASSIFFIFLGVETYNAIVLPIWEYDSVSYHLQIINHFLQTGSINSVPYTVYAGSVGYYPANGNLLALWNILPFHSTQLANLQNIISAISLFISGLFLGKKLNFSPSLSFAFVLSILYSPLLLKEMGSFHVDLFFSLSLIYVLVFLYEYFKTNSNTSALLFSLSIGLFVGTKYLGLPFSIPFILIFLVLFFKNFNHQTKIKSLKLIPPMVILFIVGGGSWYLRNLIIADNPIFPAALKLGDFTVFEGYGTVIDTIAGWSIFNNLSSLSLMQIYEMTERFFFRSGYQMLLIPIMYLLLIVFIAKKITPKKESIFFLIIIPILSLLYLKAPYTFNDFDANIRYSLPALIVGSLLVCYLGSHSKYAKNSLITLLIILLPTTLYSAFTKPDLPHELLTLNYITNKIDPQNTTAVLKHKYPSEFDSVINAFEWVNTNISDSANLAYTGFHFNAHLLGENLRRKMQYVNINSCFECDYFDYKNLKDGLFNNPNKSSWINNLDLAKIDYVILFNESGLLKFELDWIKEAPTNFKLVYQTPDSKIENKVYIYKFIAN